MEIARNRRAQDEYAVDAWQLGVLAFFMLTGRIPGRGKQMTQIRPWVMWHVVFARFLWGLI